jgi:hypothetical protein
MPKIGLDVTRNEIMRFYKLFATGSVCEPISMIGLYFFSSYFQFIRSFILFKFHVKQKHFN